MLTRVRSHTVYPVSASHKPLGDAGGIRMGWAAMGGVLGAVAASSCCIVPLLLFSVGVSGAWISQLTALAPFKPAFIAGTIGFLGYGFWLVYRSPRECDARDACARPMPNRVVKSALWVSTLLVVLALFWNWIAPVIAPVLLGI